MRRRDRPEAARVEDALALYEEVVEALPGISRVECRHVLIEQIIESRRRVEYVRRLLTMDISTSRRHPESGNFDPLKAAVLQKRLGNIDEACWLVFLAVHFGKHRQGGWRYASDVYGRIGQAGRWDWKAVAQNVEEFRDWLDLSGNLLRFTGRPGGFGNHRKYESLAGRTPTGTGAVVATYVDWIHTSGSHEACFQAAYKASASQAPIAFDELYRSMSVVHRFGRTGRFDYLAMLHKLELADICPGGPYLAGSTGPLAGARLLYGKHKGQQASASDLERHLISLEEYLEIGFDPLEDALCNWQKSPTKFKPFRG